MSESLTVIIFSFIITFDLGNAYIYSLSCHGDKNYTKPMDKLQHDVICELDSFHRPVKNDATITYVNVTFIPAFYSITEEQRMVRINGFLQMKWIDESARWTPRKYGGIQSIKASFYDIWYPKITSYDSGSTYKFLDENDRIRFEDSVIMYNGSVTIRAVGTFYGPCTFDASNWPFDEWNCKITLCKSIDEDGAVSVNFEANANINLDRLEMSNLWQIVSKPFFRESSNQQVIELEMTLQRHVTHYQTIFVFPGIVLLLMSLITFWLTNKIYCRMLVNMLTTLVQIAFIQQLFILLQENGTNGVTLYTFYLASMFVSIIGVLFAVISAKLVSMTEDPPQFVTELIGVFTAVPYCGPIFSYFINDVDSPSLIDDDEVALVSAANTKCSKKWRIISNFLDACAFFIILLYFIIFYML